MRPESCRTSKRRVVAIAIPLIVALIILLLFQYVLLIGYVPSSSMEPLIKRGSFFIADRTAYWDGEPKVGDVVVVKHVDKMLIKRVAAVEGDPLPDDSRYAYVPEGCLYLLGDNADASIDSRYWQNPFVNVGDVIARFKENTPASNR